MNSYNTVVIAYQNPDELATKTKFKIDDNIFISSNDYNIWGTIKRIWRDEEEEEDLCYPQLLNFDVIDSDGKEYTINYNMNRDDDDEATDSQWFINFNFHSDLNNSIQTTNNNVAVSK